MSKITQQTVERYGTEICCPVVKSTNVFLKRDLRKTFCFYSLGLPEGAAVL